MEFDTEEVKFECDHPECTEKHSVEILKGLPKKPLEKDLVKNFDDSNENIIAVDSGRENRDIPEEYRSNHCDMISVCTEETGYQLHCNPGLGWEIVKKTERPSGVDPDEFVKELTKDYYNRSNGKNEFHHTTE